MKNTNSPNFSGRSIKHAATWVLSGDICANILRLSSNLIMTRLLAPELFGIMAAANLILTGVSLLSDIGLSQSIVRSKNSEKQSFINTIWSLQIIRGCCIATVVYLSGLLFSTEVIQAYMGQTAYGNPLFHYALYMIAVYSLIIAFQSPHIYFLERHLQLKKKIFIELSSQIIGISVGIAYALYISRDINSLLFAMLSSACIKVLLTHLIVQGRLHCKINKQFFWEIVDYGKWIIISSILGFFILNGNQIIFSLHVDEKTLGIFSIAVFIISALSQVTGKVFSSVFFPVISQAVRDGGDKVRATYIKIKQRIDPLIFFTAGFFYFSGESIIKLIYDDRYTYAGIILSILSVGLISLCSRTIIQLYFALGKSRITSTMALINTILLFTLVPFTLHIGEINHGIWAMALVSASRAIIAMFYEYHYFKKIFINPLLIVMATIAGGLFGHITSTILLMIKGYL